MTVIDESTTVVTYQDIAELITISQFLREVQHWEAQTGSRILAKLAQKLIDAKKDRQVET